MSKTIHNVISNAQGESQAAAQSVSLQRKCACGQHKIGGGECGQCLKKQSRGAPQTAVAPAEGASVPSIVNEVLSSPGRPLDSSVRGFMEAGFGRDFSRTQVSSAQPQTTQARLTIGPVADPFEREADSAAARVTRSPELDSLNDSQAASSSYDFSRVRVHTDAQAARSALAVNALAYTVGPHIVFGESQYSPETADGKRLLAHELTHVIQQGNGPAPGPARMQRQAGPAPGPAPEPEAGPAPAPEALSAEMLKQIVRQIHQALLDGDIDSLASAFAGRTKAELDQITQAYQDEYKTSLTSDIETKLSESQRKRLGSASPSTAPGVDGTPEEQAKGLAEVVAGQLKKAMYRIGTDEDAIYAALTGRTAAEREAIKTAYQKLTNKTLEEDLKDDLSGGELKRAMLLLNNGVLAPEDELYLAMEGLGTDEDTIFRVVESMAGNVAALQGLERDYNLKYGDLVTDLRDELSGSDWMRVHKAISPTIHDADVEDCDPTKIPNQQPRTVRDAHQLAFEMLQSAIAKSASENDPTVQALASKYFKITLPAATQEDKTYWSLLRTVLGLMVSAYTEATYECEPKQNFFHGDCTGTTAAVTILNIHLCPRWFNKHPLDEQAAIMVHEWVHKFSAGIKDSSEIYCFDAGWAASPTSKLISYPDAYMQYIYELHMSRDLGCI